MSTVTPEREQMWQQQPTITAQVLQMKSTSELKEWFQGRQKAYAAIESTILREAENSNITIVDAVRCYASVVSELSGYTEFHPHGQSVPSLIQQGSSPSFNPKRGG